MSTSVDVFSNNSVVGINDLFDLCRDSDELRIFLLKSGLLSDRSGVCDICGKGNVNLTKKEGSFYWKCGARACRKTISLRKGSFFENSKLSFESILCLIYCWIYECSHRFITAARIVSTNKTIVDWKNFCRDVCTETIKPVSLVKTVKQPLDLLDGDDFE